VLGALHLVFTLLLYLIYPHMEPPEVMSGNDNSLGSFLFKLIIVRLGSLVPFLLPIVGIMSKVPGRNGHYKSIWSRVLRLVVFIVPFYSLHMGMTLFELKSMMEGLWSDDATFLTTPKRGSRNTVRNMMSDDIVAWLGLLIAAHQIYYYFIVEGSHLDRDPSKAQLMPWVTFYILGQVYVSISFLFSKYKTAMDDLVRAFQSDGSSYLTKLAIPGLVVGVGTACYLSC
jgi:hypothetical protein